MLNFSQIAALQQMGICVWLPAEQHVSSEDSSGSEGPKAVTTRIQASPNRIEQLAALRSNLNDDTKSAASETQPDTVSPAQPKPKTASAASVTPLTAAQQTDAKNLLVDIEHALALIMPNAKACEVVIGTSLKVTSTLVVLPVAPADLTAADKKQLWQAMLQQG